MEDSIMEYGTKLKELVEEQNSDTKEKLIRVLYIYASEILKD